MGLTTFPHLHPDLLGGGLRVVSRNDLPEWELRYAQTLACYRFGVRNSRIKNTLHSRNGFQGLGSSCRMSPLLGPLTFPALALARDCGTAPQSLRARSAPNRRSHPRLAARESSLERDGLRPLVLHGLPRSSWISKQV